MVLPYGANFHFSVDSIGTAANDAYIFLDSSQRPPSFLICGDVFLNIVAPNPSTLVICRSASSNNAKLLPPPAAPPYTAMSALVDRNFSCAPSCGFSETAGGLPVTRPRDRFLAGRYSHQAAQCGRFPAYRPNQPLDQ